jgi:hypothetical protein
MIKQRSKLFLIVAVFVTSISLTSFGFTTPGFLSNNTEDNSDDLQDAARWTATNDTFVGSNTRGLGGGIEYSIEGNFYAQITSSFVDSTGVTQDQIKQAIRRAFDRWASGSPLSFTDVSGQIFAIRDAASPGSGSEIDIFAIPGGSIDFVGNSLSGNTIQQVSSSQPKSTNGSSISGRTLTSADILINKDRMYYLNPNDPQVQSLQSQGQFLVHFESLIQHEIGHAIGLDHPDEWWTRNFDSDSDPNNSMNINCNSPASGLQLSQNFPRNAVMSAQGSHLVRMTLTGDDLGGRAFLYPSCSGGGSASPPTPPPPSPTPSPPPSTPPPASPPPSSGGSSLQSFDQNNDCFLQDGEFFNLLDAWVGGSLDNIMFFAGADAWIGQTSVCAVGASMASDKESKSFSLAPMLRSKNNRILFSAEDSVVVSTQIEIFDLFGNRVYSAKAKENYLSWNLRDMNHLQVANGVYLYVGQGLTRDGKLLTGKVQRLILLR